MPGAVAAAEVVAAAAPAETVAGALVAGALVAGTLAAGAAECDVIAANRAKKMQPARGAAVNADREVSLMCGSLGAH